MEKEIDTAFTLSTFMRDIWLVGSISTVQYAYLHTHTHTHTHTNIDEPRSSITAHLDHDSGLLTASISTEHDHYYIEPSHHHLNASHGFHMISYRASDLKYNLTRCII